MLLSELLEHFRITASWVLILTGHRYLALSPSSRRATGGYYFIALTRKSIGTNALHHIL
jgi:hypothetical protein